MPLSMETKLGPRHISQGSQTFIGEINKKGFLPFLVMPNALYILFFNMKGVYSHFNGKMSHIPYVVAAAHWTLVCDISLLPFVLALFCVTL